MKRRIILQALETLHKRIEDAKKASDQDPYIDAYVMQNKLIKELIDLLKSNTDSLIDVQLLHWIDRQEHAGKAVSEIVKKENQQMTLDDFLKETD